MSEGGLTFDDVAELYDRVRPRYPEEQFDRIQDVADLGPGARVLELGSGTGIATRELLDRGWHVDCVEPGAALIEGAMRNLGGSSGLTIHNTTFESWLPSSDPYDLVISATAFHWIDADVRFRKTHDVLRPGGHLAVMQYRHVAGDDADLFERLQDCYVRHMPGAKRQRLPVPDKRTATARDMRRSGLFEVVEEQMLAREIEYSRAGYLDLLSTYSGHRLLGGERLAALSHCIGELIDREGGGRIRKAYAFELVIGRAQSLEGRAQ